jgi:hypothetical protein
LASRLSPSDRHFAPPFNVTGELRLARYYFRAKFGGVCWVNTRSTRCRAISPRTLLAASHDNDATHKDISSMRKYAAVETESPTPVPIAMYAARHTGHFGKSARMTPGAIHLDKLSQLDKLSRYRAGDGRCGLPFVVARAAIALRCEPLKAPAQLQLALTGGAPPNSTKNPYSASRLRVGSPFPMALSLSASAVSLIPRSWLDQSS